MIKIDVSFVSSFITLFPKLKRCLLGNRNFSTIPVKNNMQSKISKKLDYEACIEALNGLQSNAQYIKAKATINNHNGDQLLEVEKYLNRAGVSLDQLDDLSVIHVAGTKGKGTTCAFSERILRDHGFKTGFFSSPHLFEVRERIRINGKPIEKDDFVKYFWKIYSSLDQKKSDDHDMPLYFRFLTILAFYVFLEKKVDVAIVEVGIGGEYDCTNVLRKVPVVGITSLGIDHVTLLGSTIEKIAWNKAGIMKRGCQAFTVPQPETALSILKERSIEKKCQLKVVENGLQYKFPTHASSYPPHILNLNASLAVTLCEAWLKQTRSQALSKETTEQSLFNCRWPGRYQVKHTETISFYLDGAHTLESVSVCAKWFKDITKSSQKKKALMFNVTGDRNAESLLKELQICGFDAVVFVTNLASSSMAGFKSDNTNCKSVDELVTRCRLHQQLWRGLEEKRTRKAEICEAFPTIADGIEFLTNQEKYDLLITGSLQLVGSVLSLIDPNLNDFS